MDKSLNEASAENYNTLKGSATGNQPALQLSDKMVINKGRERICYEHPENDQLVIKIPLSNIGRKSRANHSELKGYLLLREEKKDLSFVSHCHGFVNTNHGEGLMCDCIRDNDGAISKTIWDIIVFEENCDVEYILQVAEKFCNFLMFHKIWLFDLNLKNIAFKLLADGTYKPYVIDMKGRYVNHEIIPLSKFIPYFAEKKLKRRSEQLLRRIPEYRRKRKELQATS
jgi:hypothetical protein